MNVPEVNEVDRLRATRAIERLMPDLDMRPPYGEFAIASVGRFMTMTRGTAFSEDLHLAAHQAHDLLAGCFTETREEMGLIEPDNEVDLGIRTAQINLSFLAAELVAEAMLEG